MGSSSSSHEVSGGVAVDERKAEWKIEEFEVVKSSDALIRAQELEFCAGSSIGLPTRWVCSLKDVNEVQKRWIGVHINLLDKPEDSDEVNVSFEVTVKNSLGRPFFTDKVACVDMANKSKLVNCGFNRVIDRDFPIKDLPLVNGALLIQLDFRLYAPKPRLRLDTDLEEKMEQFKVKSLSRLVKDLGNTQILTSAKADSETLIVSKDNQTFPVNRGLLSVRSPVFEKMFQADMREANSGTCKLDDLGGKAIAVILQYVMQGTLHASWKQSEVIEELLVGAHRYELDLLVEFLDNVLESVCVVKNALKLAKMAKTLGMKRAERELVAWLKKNAMDVDDFGIKWDETGDK